MARPLILPKYFDQEDFRSLYKKYGTKKYGIRLLAMHYLQDGKGVKETATLLVKTEFTIRDWVRLYSEGGIDGLLSIRTGRGRKPKLSSQNESNLKLEIDELSSTLNGGRVRAADIRSRQFNPIF